MGSTKDPFPRDKSFPSTVIKKLVTPLTEIFSISCEFVVQSSKLSVWNCLQRQKKERGKEQ